MQAPRSMPPPRLVYSLSLSPQFPTESLFSLGGQKSRPRFDAGFNICFFSLSVSASPSLSLADSSNTPLRNKRPSRLSRLHRANEYHPPIGDPNDSTFTLPSAIGVFLSRTADTRPWVLRPIHQPEWDDQTKLPADSVVHLDYKKRPADMRLAGTHRMYFRSPSLSCHFSALFSNRRGLRAVNVSGVAIDVSSRTSWRRCWR